MATFFKPRNKRLYTGREGRRLMSYAGQEVRVLGEITRPASQTKSRQPERVLFIRFVGAVGKAEFLVRPCDVAEE